MARTKQAARKKQQDADGAAAGGDEPKKCRKLMRAGRNGQVSCVVTIATVSLLFCRSTHMPLHYSCVADAGQVREVRADGSLGPIEKRPNSGKPSDAAPAGISKYNGCSREEVIKNMHEIRERKSILDKKKNAIPGRQIALPPDEKVLMREYVRDLDELDRVLKGLDAAAGGEASSSAPLMPASAADDQVGGAESASDEGAEEALAFSGSDDE